MSSNKTQIIKLISSFIFFGIYLFLSSSYARESVADRYKDDGDSNILEFKEKLVIQSNEIFTGKVISVNNLVPSTRDDYSYFEIEVLSIDRSKSRLSIHDIVKVRYNNESPIITGNKPVLIKEDFVIKVYAASSLADAKYIDIRYGGDSLEILEGEEPSEIDYYLGLVGLNLYNLSTEVKTVLLIVGIILGTLIITNFLKKIIKVKRY